MTRGIDFSGLSPAERGVFVAGATLFVDGFLPWWYRIRTPGGTYLHSAGLSGWGLVAVLAGFSVAVFALSHSVRRKTRGKGEAGFYLVTGGIALGSLAVQGRSPAGEWIGYWLAVAASVAILVAGVRRVSERRSGWV